MSFVSPIQHKIPSSADYKNVNINNFTGTCCSDNLFDGKSSGCQESENVYVNEQNILAVRPRLEKVAKFKNIEEIKNVSVIGNDEMIYYVTTNAGTDCLILSDKSNPGAQDQDKKITLESPNTLGECSFIKDGDGVIVAVSENGLYQIDFDNGKLIPINSEHEKVYIPTTKVDMQFGDATSGSNTSFVPNGLSDKYYQEHTFNLN